VRRAVTYCHIAPQCLLVDVADARLWNLVNKQVLSIAIDDLLIGRLHERRMPQLLEDQRILMAELAT
jgi:hypothetical protein